MSDLVCLPKTYLFSILFIFIIFASLYMYNEPRMNKTYLVSDNINRDFVVTDTYLSNRDKNVLYNDFAPPERRDPSYQYPTKYVRNNINIPTRGIPDTYQLLGVLLRDNTETAYKLFGRQIYPGSSQYEYYAQSVMYNNDIKLPIKIRGDKEVTDNEVIQIPGTDPGKGEFKVKLYNYDAPRYFGSV
jgi:hypothetical protein